MTCRKVRKLVPLAAGGDLPQRQARAFQAHIDACPGCRAELERFRADLAAVAAEAKAAGVAGWSEPEWSALMARVRREGAAARRHGTGFGPGRSRRGWAPASALGAAVGLALLFGLLDGPGTRRPAAAAGGPEALVSEAKPQDVLTMTMVSPETGLQIVWFFDRNFDYGGEQE